MKKLLSLALLGVGARWVLDAERRSALIARVGGARGGLARGAAAVRDSAGELAGSAAGVAGSVASRAADVVPGTGGGSSADGDPATFAGNPDDARLTDKVESELFRPDGVPKGQINVNVEFGKVVLRGEVESRELIDDLVSRAREIDGVTDVESLLHLPGEPAPMHE
jgi:osmotically-inducible protein OsmY